MALKAAGRCRTIIRITHARGEGLAQCLSLARGGTRRSAGSEQGRMDPSEDAAMALKSTPRPVNGSSATAPPGPSMPLAPPTGPKKRRPVVFLAAAIAAIVAGGALAVWAVQTSGDRTAVVGVAVEVPWGQPLTTSDLVQIDVIQDTNMRAIPWSQRDTLVGQRAATDLLPGTLLVPDSVTAADAIPPAGQAVVGVTVKPSQAPQQQLVANDQVLLVVAAKDNAEAKVTTYQAQVLSASAADASGSRTVDVLITEKDAATVALAASGGQITIVLVPRS